MRNFGRDERGASMVIVALSMVVIIGMAAVSLDAGYLYFRHTRLQDVSDAAALAGAIEMADTNGSDNHKKNAAFDSVLDYMQKNGIDASAAGGYTAAVTNGAGESGTLTVEFPDGIKQVKVTLSLDSSLFFARIFGDTQTPVAVSATAALGVAANQTGNLVPIGIYEQTYVIGTEYRLSLGPSAAASGNFNFLTFDATSQFSNYMTNGYAGTLSIGDILDTYTGADTGQVAHAIDTRMADTDCTGLTAADWATCPASCARLVIVPIVRPVGPMTGTSEVEIMGFAKFYITSYDQGAKELYGVFVSDVEPGEIIPSDNLFVTQNARLIQ